MATAATNIHYNKIKPTNNSASSISPECDGERYLYSGIKQELGNQTSKTPTTPLESQEKENKHISAQFLTQKKFTDENSRCDSQSKATHSNFRCRSDDYYHSQQRVNADMTDAPLISHLAAQSRHEQDFDVGMQPYYNRNYSYPENIFGFYQSKYTCQHITT